MALAEMGSEMDSIAQRLGRRISFEQAVLEYSTREETKTKVVRPPTAVRCSVLTSDLNLFFLLNALQPGESSDHQLTDDDDQV